jgi:protein TonB
MLTKRVDPVYPPLAQQARIQGIVTLNVVISKEGAVESVSVAQGHPLLVQAAIDAVKQWVYQTTTLNGQPVAVSTVVQVPFELQQ